MFAEMRVALTLSAKQLMETGAASVPVRTVDALGAQGRAEPRQMPPRLPAEAGVPSASRRSTVGALARCARADTPQPTLSR